MPLDGGAGAGSAFTLGCTWRVMRTGTAVPIPRPP